jgi:hypothetical protein
MKKVEYRLEQHSVTNIGASGKHVPEKELKRGQVQRMVFLAHAEMRRRGVFLLG